MAKKFKKLKITIKNSLSSQNRLEKDEKERNKNYRSILFRSHPMRNRKYHKNSKKFKKKKKNDYGSFQAKIGRKRMRNMKSKNIVSFRSYQTRRRKFQKKLKNTIVDSFQAKIDWRMMRKRENKNYTSVTFLSDT